MNSNEIQKILERILNPSKVKFLGVFPRDLMPKPKDLTQFPTCFVINSDISSEPGAHWLAIYYDKANSCEFYDSYGFDYRMYHIDSKMFSTKVLCNSKQIQCYTSTVCGQHCIYFLYYRSLGLKISQIIRKFSSSNHRGNDLYVGHFVNKLSTKSISFHVCSNSASPLIKIQNNLSRIKSISF